MHRADGAIVRTPRRDVCGGDQVGPIRIGRSEHSHACRIEVDFVEDDGPVGAGSEERLGASEERPRAREFAVEVVGVGQGSGQRGLAKAAGNGVITTFGRFSSATDRPATPGVILAALPSERRQNAF
jgi:hypothetical protein